MNLLILDCTLDRHCWGSEDLIEACSTQPGNTIFTRRPPHQDLPLNVQSFDRLIISGSRSSCLEESPWIDQLILFIRKFAEKNKPILGICFGHQMIVRAFDGKTNLGKLKTPLHGWSEIELLEKNHSLFSGLPQQFYSFSHHSEAVFQLSSSFKVLARSKLCEIQAYEMYNKPVYGIQFHPEKTPKEATTLIQSHLNQKTSLADSLKDHSFYDPKVCQTIFQQFLKL